MGFFQLLSRITNNGEFVKSGACSTAERAPLNQWATEVACSELCLAERGSSGYVRIYNTLAAE